MTTAKTVISLELTLLEQADKLAEKTGNSRSGVIAIALQKYFYELKQREIIAQLNSVYEEDVSSDSELIETAKVYFTNNVATESER